ncbi:sugar transferase [Niveispirillum sp. KHB5.9]|uniref:sugar transferase n=1 Tax=Niveispirillum sp. KHB5.9 TaxID=3400269 RepID=UPI003A8B4ED1
MEPPAAAIGGLAGTGPGGIALDRPEGHPLLVPFLIVVADSVLLQILTSLATMLREEMAVWMPIGINPSLFHSIHIMVLFLPLLYMAAGLTPGYGRVGVERLRTRVTVTATFFASMLLFDHVAQGGQWSRGILLITGALAVIVMPVGDALVRHFLIRRNLWGTPVAVLGPPSERARLLAELNAHPELGWVPVLEADTAPSSAPPGVNLALLTSDGLNLSVLAHADRLPFRKVVLACGLTNTQSQWVASRDLGGQLGLEMQRNLLLPWNRAVKRVMDLLLVLVLLPLAALICLPFVAGLLVLSPGPVFYAQQRQGLNGRPIQVLKLRSMYPDAEARLAALLAESPAARAEWTATLKLRHDPRLIPGIAALMRRFSIDELPQLLNVLKGEMSIVGPRPLPGYHLDALTPDACALRRKVRPGITGLWQVSGRSALPMQEMERLDGYYVRNWSIWLDIHILARTAVEVMRGRGAW